MPLCELLDEFSFEFVDLCVDASMMGGFPDGDAVVDALCLQFRQGELCPFGLVDEMSDFDVPDDGARADPVRGEKSQAIGGKGYVFVIDGDDGEGGADASEEDVWSKDGVVVVRREEVDVVGGSVPGVDFEKVGFGFDVGDDDEVEFEAASTHRDPAEVGVVRDRVILETGGRGAHPSIAALVDNLEEPFVGVGNGVWCDGREKSSGKGRRGGGLDQDGEEGDHGRMKKNISTF
jgi:hypothetical protein